MKINKTKSGQVRQGDVLLVPTNIIPKTAKRLKKCILALGEVTGHAHVIEDGVIAFAEEGELAEYAQIKDDNIVIQHQEHDVINIKKGKYKKAFQVNYTPEAIKRVMD